MTDILRLSLPLTVWLIAFSGLYGLQAILCQTAWVESPAYGVLTFGRAVLVGAWILVVLVQTALISALTTARFGGSTVFIRQVSIALAFVALISSIWTLSPAALLPMCLE